MRITKYLVSYKGDLFSMWVDGGGLDGDFSKENEAIRHELFCKVVDTYKVVGLEKALEDAGAIIIVISEVAA